MLYKKAKPLSSQECHLPCGLNTKVSAWAKREENTESNITADLSKVEQMARNAIVEVTADDWEAFLICKEDREESWIKDPNWKWNVKNS
jgi:hypothetical protein